MILLTLDTTRADALGVYGARKGTTPHLDNLAETGVQFRWALSHVPSTLSSHASMFTGLDPHGHGVPRNGHALSPEHDTLARRLTASGYDTRAVIGASVLDHRLGLDAGFFLYDDTLLPVDQGIRHEDLADSVTNRALQAVDGRNPEAPLFLWVHYFDAHHPYEAPETSAGQFVDTSHVPPWREIEGLDAGKAFQQGLADSEDMAWLRTTYQAEVHWMDSQIGRLLEGLEARGLLEEAVIAVVGDHGEMFGEEPTRPMGHSFDIDLAVTRVPFLIAVRSLSDPTPRVINQPVKVSDLGPTLLAQAGLSGDLGEGQDLSPLMNGQTLAGSPIFLEATRGSRAPDGRNWNNLLHERGVLMNERLFIRSPLIPDRVHALDGAQTELVLDESEMRTFQRKLKAWDNQAPSYRPPIADPHLQAPLEALGYLDNEDP